MGAFGSCCFPLFRRSDENNATILAYDVRGGAAGAEPQHEPEPQHDELLVDGAARAEAVKRAIGMAKLAVDTGFVSQMYQDLESVHARLEEQ